MKVDEEKLIIKIDVAMKMMAKLISSYMCKRWTYMNIFFYINGDGWDETN